MTVRERGLLAAGLLLLAVIGLGLVSRAPAPSVVVGSAEPTPSIPDTALREGVVGRIETLDPLYATDPAERDVIALLFRGLTRLGAGAAIEPDLAAGWEIADGGRTWTFTLREDVRWHDGRPVTADDVAFTVLSLQHPDYDGPFAGPWRDVIVERLGPFAVRFRLREPLASFLAATTQPIVPAHLLAAIPVAERRFTAFGREPVGSGPFRLASLDDAAARLVRFGPPLGGPRDLPPDDPLATLPPPTPASPPAGPPRPLLDALELRVFATPDEAAAAFRAGELDALGGLPTVLTAELAALPGVRRVVYPTTVVTAVVFNLRSAASPFRDPRARRALLMSIDRDAIVSAVLDGAGIVAETPISPVSPFHDPSAAPAVAHDTAAAARLLKAAGWTRGTAGWRQPKGTAVVAFTVDTLDTATNPTLNAVAARVVADWTAFGLQPTLQGYGAAQLVEGRLLVDEFEVAVVEINLGLDPDLFPLLASSQAVQGGTNVAGYQSTKLDALLAAARDQADPETRRTRFAALEARLAEELPFLTLHFGERVELLRERVEGPSTREISASSERFWDVLAWHLAGTPDP